jgi:hypothetical protein
MQEKINKEYYIDLIKKAAKHIENHAEDYLCDYEIAKIKNLNIIIDIEPLSCPEIIVNKTYFPREVIDETEVTRA